MAPAEVSGNCASLGLQAGRNISGEEVLERGKCGVCMQGGIRTVGGIKAPGSSEKVFVLGQNKQY